MGGLERGWSRSFMMLVALIALLMPILVFAQTVYVGTILGTVKDTSGAVVTGANVTVRETQTGISRMLLTENDGTYRFAALPVGHYEVKVEAKGFKTETQTGIVLNVAQEVVIDFSLQVGSLNSQITVTAAPPVVDTTSSMMGGLVDEKSMAELPLNGRNYLDLSLLQPGVSQDTLILNEGGGTMGTIYSSNGAPITSNAFLLDGTPTQSVLGLNGASATGTSLGADGILEYKVLTNSFSAEYGMSMGSQMTMISKGGANQFHGDVFEYLRNRVIDARNYFDYSQEYCLAAGGTDCPRSPQYERNNFGGAFGGPIKKNKTFFWAVYEGLRQVKGNPIVAKGIPADCVSAGVAGEVVTTAECGVPIPAGMTVNSTIRPVLALYAPQYATYTQISHQTVDHAQMRIDQNFSDKNTFFARYTIDDADEIYPGPGYGPTEYGFSEFQDQSDSRSQFITLSESHIFTPQLLNTARLSFARVYMPQGCSTVDPIASAADVLNNPGSPMGEFVIGSTGMTSSYYTVMGTDDGCPVRKAQTYWTLSDDMFYTKGRHALKFGFLGNRIRFVNHAVWTPNGDTTFANSCSDNTSGDPSGLVCFLANQPFMELAEIPGSRTDYDLDYYTYGFYVQDDWRVKSRLTLNLGLRYEFNTTLNEVHGFQSSILNPAAEVSTVGGSGWTNPVIPGPDYSNPSLKNFSPRVGFAFDPTGKGTTAIHGAFGLYYDVGIPGVNIDNYTAGDPPPYSSLQANVTTAIGGYLRSWAPNYIATPAAYYGQFQPPFPWPGATNTFAGFFSEDLFTLSPFHIKQTYLMQWSGSVRPTAAWQHRLDGGVCGNTRPASLGNGRWESMRSHRLCQWAPELG